MKSLYTGILICVLVLLAGCLDSDASNSSNITPDLKDAEPVYVTQWPENEFTSQIAKPGNGNIDYVYDCSDSGYYGIFIKDIKKEESEDYIVQLKKLGYAEVNSASNDISVGTILQKDDTALSISYSDGVLSILINKKIS